MIRTMPASLAPVGDAARLRAGADASSTTAALTSALTSVWCTVQQSMPNAGMTAANCTYAAFGTKRHGQRPSEVLIT